MTVPKHLIYLLLVLSLSFINAYESFVEEFVDGSTGIFSPCKGKSSFVVEKYSQDESGVKPSGSDGFFLTADTNISKSYCIESGPIIVTLDSQLKLTMYTSNSGIVKFFNWAVIDPLDNSIMTYNFHKIDDRRTWFSSIIYVNFVFRKTIYIRLYFDSTGTGKEFIAIDRVEIQGELVTTTAPLTSTSLGTTEAMTATPIGTTDEATTTESAPQSSPPPTPEPPSAPNCLCNCNCNYYCGNNPSH